MTNPASLDERLESLNARVAQLELATTGGHNGGSGSGKAARISAEAAQAHPLLQRLKPAAGAAGLEVEQLRAERDKALEQVEQLKKENGKLEYRVMHLVRAVDALEKAAAAGRAK